MAVDTDKSWRIAEWMRAADLGRAPGLGRIARLGTAVRSSPLARLFERISLPLPFSSLAWRILFFNVIALVILAVGVLYFSEYQAWLIGAKRESLRIQGEIIAAAIADRGMAERGRLAVDTDLLLEEDGDASANLLGGEDDLAALEFPIKPELVAPILRRLIQPTGTRARIYSKDGTLILDSDSLFAPGEVVRADLPALDKTETPGAGKSLWARFTDWLFPSDLPIYRDIGRANGKAYSEVRLALSGTTTPMLKINEKGEQVVSIAVPIRRMSSVLGALLLSTRGGEIEGLVRAEQLAITRAALIALLATIVSTVLLVVTIARPLRRLSNAADRLRESIRGGREQIPDYTDRSDEIGHLSGALRDMTSALIRRIEASEKFAADVAHELKNPLTSVRSAAEVLPRVRSEDERAELARTIQHDVRRLDRLISDISNASRLEAEMALAEAEPVDIARLLDTVVGVFNEVHVRDGQSVVLEIADAPLGSDAYVAMGHDSRLGQVMTNLLDNALSFSPPDGIVHVRARRDGPMIEITVEDEGPGVPEEGVERLFERFYTDRPDAASFGQNSGLGLSISRDVVLAHGGQIFAENRHANAGNGEKTGEQVLGARFVVRLPAANPVLATAGGQGGWRG